MLVTIFNDKDDNNAQDLQKAIDLVPGVENLKHKPICDPNPLNFSIDKRQPPHGRLSTSPTSPQEAPNYRQE
jgi:hypothetical protein